MWLASRLCPLLRLCAWPPRTPRWTRSRRTTTRPPGDGGVDVPATFSFVASVMGEVNAEEVLAGETNQVKLTLEEQLLALCDEVIAGEGGSGRRRGDAILLTYTDLS